MQASSRGAPPSHGDCTDTFAAQRSRRSVSVSAASEDVLVIAAHDSSRAQAIAVSNAVANAFVTFSTSSAVDVSNTLTSTLSQRVTQITNQIQQLQDQIASGS